MGLDTVEIIMQIEDFFMIQIKDDEAENILTIQDMVNVITEKRKVINQEKEISKRIKNKLIEAFIELKLIAFQMKESDFVFNVIPPNPDIWNSIEKMINLRIPLPRLNGNFFNNPSYKWKELTLNNLVFVISSFNYLDLFSKRKPNTQEEVLFGVAGITIKFIGDPYEISSEKSFVNDLGLN